MDMLSLNVRGVHMDSPVRCRETFSLCTDSKTFIAAVQNCVSVLSLYLQFLNTLALSCLLQNQEIEELTKICDELIAKLGTE